MKSRKINLLRPENKADMQIEVECVLGHMKTVLPTSNQPLQLTSLVLY